MKTLIALIILAVTSVTHAADPIPPQVIAAAKKIVPNFSPELLQTSPVNGLYRLSFGAQILYMSADGKYAVRGDVIDIEQGINLTDEIRKRSRVEILNSMEESMIVFSPEGEPKGTVTVFTDTTCPYCSKLHSEVAQLNAQGVKVRYLAYPRAGVPSAAANTLISVWCADDPLQAMTLAKAGKEIAAKTCENPIKKHYDLGIKLGVRGTPAVYLDDGTVAGGYVPYMQLAQHAVQAAAAR